MIITFKLYTYIDFIKIKCGRYHNIIYYNMPNLFCWKKNISCAQCVFYFKYYIVLSRVDIPQKWVLNTNSLYIPNPYFFHYLIRKKRPSRIAAHWKAPTSPTSYKLNSFLFMVIEHNFSVRCALNNGSNSLGNFFIFNFYFKLGDLYRVAKSVNNTSCTIIYKM